MCLTQNVKGNPHWSSDRTDTVLKVLHEFPCPEVSYLDIGCRAGCKGYFIGNEISVCPVLLRAHMVIQLACVIFGFEILVKSEFYRSVWNAEADVMPKVFNDTRKTLVVRQLLDGSREKAFVVFKTHRATPTNEVAFSKNMNQSNILLAMFWSVPFSSMKLFTVRNVYPFRYATAPLLVISEKTSDSENNFAFFVRAFVA